MPLPRLDRWIRLLLLPLTAGFLALHLQQVVQTGLWQPPVFAAAGADRESYPVVAGDTLEVQGAPHDLRVGDRLIRIGARDLRGHGYLGFMGRAHEEVDPNGWAPLWIERDGQPIETSLRMEPFAVPWVRVPFLFLIWSLCVYLAWRRPGDPTVQSTIITLSAIVIGESIFDGGGLLQASVAKLVFIFGGAVWFPLLIRWIAYFPAPPPRRLPTALRIGMGVSALLWTAPKLQFLLGGPAPTPWIPAIMSGGDSLGVVLAFSWFGVNYSQADEAKRRSLRWIFYTTFVTGILMVAALALPVFVPGSANYGLAIGAAGITSAIIPVGFLISMTAYDLLDIDRLISATAAYSLLLVSFLAVLLSVVPGLAGLAAPTFGIDAETSRLVLSILAAALVVPAAQWLRPRIDEWFFPERGKVEDGMDALLDEQSSERDAASLATLLARRILDIFDPSFAAVFVREPGRYRAAPPLAPIPIDSIPFDAPILQELGDATRPLVLDSRQQAGLRVRESTSTPRPLAEAEAALLLPVRQGEGLEALVFVGRKRSGDVYTGGELALLRASLEAARRQLDRARESEARIEEQHRAESIDRERRRIEAAQLARSRQLAVASHDLRQPLHAMRLSAEALLEGVDRRAERATIERIHTSATSLQEMFDSLIDVAHLEQGSLAVSIAEVPLDPLMERLVAEAEPMATAKGLLLAARPCGGTAVSDPVLLARILQNLLVNAIRYTETGSVNLAASRAGNAWTLEVADTGPGIPEALQDEIFGEFVRLASPGSDRGLGLGLSIVQRLCQRLEHEITLESVPGQGSIFSVRVLAEEAPSVTPPDPLGDIRAGFEGRRVLVIDDDLDVLAAMRTLLAGWGAEVSVATDLEEAVSASREAPDAIVADYRLAQGAKGTAVVAAIRERAGRPVPAVIVTGSTSAEVLEEIAAAGMPCLAKPVAPARLRAALASAFSRA